MSFPSEVPTLGRCRFCGEPTPPAKRRDKVREYCHNRHRYAWWDWRWKLAKQRVEDAAQVIAAEMQILKRRKR